MLCPGVVYPCSFQNLDEISKSCKYSSPALSTKFDIGLSFYLFPVVSLSDDFKYRNSPPLPPMPCQVCGQPGDKEKYCPDVRELGF
jgi:hypothetical protein